MSNPAAAGPINRALCTIVEFNAMALARSCRSVTMFDHERLPAGNVQRVDQALHQRQPHGPVHVDVMAQRQRRQRERLQHGQRLRPHEKLAAIEPVHPDAETYVTERKATTEKDYVLLFALPSVLDQLNELR